MRRAVMYSLLALGSACKAQIDGAPTESKADGAVEPPSDAPEIDAPDIRLGPWRAAAKIRGASGTLPEDDVTLSSNTLELLFAINGANGKDLYYMSRASTAEDWTPAAPLLLNNNSRGETPRLSADDKTLYFASTRAGNGTLDIYKATRPAAGSTTWSLPQAITTVNTTALNEKWFMPCGTDRYVMVQDGKDDTDLVEGTLGGGAPTPITALNEPTDVISNETGTFLSQDCLTIYFASTRVTPTKIFQAQRASITAPWQPPTPVNDFPLVGGNGNQEDPWISSDGRTFAFASDAAGTANKDLYLSTR